MIEDVLLSIAIATGILGVHNVIFMLVLDYNSKLESNTDKIINIIIWFVATFGILKCLGFTIHTIALVNVLPLFGYMEHMEYMEYMHHSSLNNQKESD